MLYVYYVVCCMFCGQNYWPHSVICLTIIPREKNIYNHSNL